MNENLRKIESLYGEDLKEILEGIVNRGFHSQHLEIQRLNVEIRNLAKKTSGTIEDLATNYPLSEPLIQDEFKDELNNQNESLNRQLEGIDSEYDQLAKEQIDANNRFARLNEAINKLQESQTTLEPNSEAWIANQSLIDTYSNSLERNRLRIHEISEQLKELNTRKDEIQHKLDLNSLELDNLPETAIASKVDFVLLSRDLDKLKKDKETVREYENEEKEYRSAIDGMSNLSILSNQMSPVEMTAMVDKFNDLMSSRHLTSDLEYQRKALEIRLDEMQKKTHYDVYKETDIDNGYKANYVLTRNDIRNRIYNNRNKIKELDDKLRLETDLSVKDTYREEIRDLNIENMNYQECLERIKNDKVQIFDGLTRNKEIEQMRQLQSQIESINDKISRLNQIKEITNSIVNNQNVITPSSPALEPVLEPIVEPEPSIEPVSEPAPEVTTEQPIRTSDNNDFTNPYNMPYSSFNMSDLGFENLGNSRPTMDQEEIFEPSRREESEPIALPGDVAQMEEDNLNPVSFGQLPDEEEEFDFSMPIPEAPTTSDEYSDQAIPMPGSFSDDDYEEEQTFNPETESELRRMVRQAIAETRDNSNEQENANYTEEDVSELEPENYSIEDDIIQSEDVEDNDYESEDNDYELEEYEPADLDNRITLRERFGNFVSGIVSRVTNIRRNGVHR